VLLGILLLSLPLLSQAKQQINKTVSASSSVPKEEKLVSAMHSISSHSLFDYVKRLCAEDFEGRLTGTPTYDASAKWVADHLEAWNVKPGGDNGTFFQKFPNPYTLVLDGGQLTLHVPVKKHQSIDKHYRYQDEYFPGSTSDSGKIKAEVIYVGYGITAPELGYDDYKGVNVKGKIVLVEREIPVAAPKDPEMFKKWRPYSFHQYKVKNAFKHGAAGMLYNYHIVNPNCLYIKGLLLTQVGETVVNDVFQGTGKSHKAVLDKIKKNLKPRSFRTKKIVTICNSTQHHPEGIGSNVIGIIEGSDPALRNEVIMLGGHLDHLGLNHKMMPGANDNASAVAVMMGIARAIHLSGLNPKRSIAFNFFGSEEQGVKGSEFYLKNPIVPNKNVIGFLNMDGVGRGKQLVALAAKNYPELWKFVEDANNKYIHRKVFPTHFQNLARPRLDAARFMWAGIPTISFMARGAKAFPYPTYHTTHDNPSIIEPEIMEDLAQLLFVAVMNMADY
jgi:hypothetical protein